MGNLIITEPSRNLRMLGRQALQNRWKAAVIAVLIFEICTTLPPLILNQFFGVSVAEITTDIMNALYGDELASLYGTGYLEAPYTDPKPGMKISNLSGLYHFLVEGAFTLGLTSFFLNLFRRRSDDPAQVFYGFEHFFKALGLMFMIGLFTFLWSLLFVVPGIIAAFRYSQAFYILADDPSKGVMQCIRESKMMMRGNKGKLFCLTLSFIGWALLTGVAIGAVAAIFSIVIREGSAGAVILDWILNLAFAGVLAYLYAAQTAFYDILIGNLRVAGVTGGPWQAMNDGLGPLSGHTDPYDQTYRDQESGER